MNAERNVADTFDLIVLGSGAGGMTAALVASLDGLRVLLIESSDAIGGTTALSSGTVWIPGNRHQLALGTHEDPQAALTYLDALVGDRADAALREAFVAAGARMVDELHERTDVRFEPLQSPDYRQDLPGAAQGGRALAPLPFDGRTLGADFALLRWPLRELMLFGGMMVTRAEAVRLLSAHRSLDAFRLGAHLVSRFALDRLRHRRGTRLVLGNALAARLLRNLRERGVEVMRQTRAVRLVRGEDGKVAGLVVAADPGERRIGSRFGVVLAGGGFPASAALRERYLPRPVAEYTAACGNCTGETLSLAETVGAAIGPPGEDNALWFPSSIARRPDGSTAVYPHIALDRSKPGLVAVNASGRRFVDEAVSYHEFVRAMYRAHRSVPSIPAVLVCDRRFVWKYGLGLIRPRTPALASYVRRGYLHVGDTIEALARSVGVDAAGLAETVEANNRYARSGVDPEFGKGGTSYDRCNGDPAHGPNPCLGPIDRAPFCAVKVHPTPLGTSLGVRTDAAGRVLDGSGAPIGGLYACGNDMQSIMGGEYPGPGAQIGIAMTFGYLAAKDAAARAAAGITPSRAAAGSAAGARWTT